MTPYLDLLAYAIGIGCIYWIFSKMQHEKVC